MKGGGHAMAAGITLRKDALGPFRAYLEETLAPAVEAARRDDALLVDGALTARAANAELVATIARAGPFGAGNPEPLIALPAHTVAYAEEVGQAHVRARFQAGDGGAIGAIAFRAVGQKLGQALHREPRAPGPCAGLALARPLAGRGAHAVPPDRRRLRRPGRPSARVVRAGWSRALSPRCYRVISARHGRARPGHPA